MARLEQPERAMAGRAGARKVRLLPLCRARPIAPSFWSVPFWYAAAAIDNPRWIQVEPVAGETLLACAVLGVIIKLVGGVALRSLFTLQQGTFLPAPTP